YIEGIGRERILAHEIALRDYATRRLSEVNSLRIIGTAKEKGSIVSSVMENAHPHDIATVIDRAGVAVRAGHHCAQPVMERFGVGATTRASFAMYNTLEEVDRLADALDDARKFFE
ncbi:MAG: aminotransferase class V-fold PLP-dependent enzyme, partial [Alphaproteobacteria bacterium]|nr:aminotransferase class V-fold PLP-dependent enzyme [Alphaproteobacteria bacterium]MDX5415774.1 aminotransferase class V-fold PLP-dependent enzyme [Alphaproteobacteria bacterium]MDX5493044.1 aminotransferase class V-fold PLP-dependent enzyme [Alphaproteobacteria bacterium]